MKTRRKQQGGHHLYKRLGVSKYASQKLIRKAFKTLKKKRKANKKVKEAYKILSNKKTRKQYNDRYYVKPLLDSHVGDLCGDLCEWRPIWRTVRDTD